MVDRVTLPTRNVVAKTALDDQRFIRWFEDTTDTVNALSRDLSAGSGSILDMGDRIIGSSLYDGGARV